MGEHKKLRCRNCEEYANVGKIRPEFDEGHFPGNRELAIHFMYVHEGHLLELVGEYSSTQNRWMETNERHGWEEFSL